MEIKQIHSLNARNNVQLEVMRDYFNLTPDRMLVEIQGMRQRVVSALASKGVDYDALGAALCPDRKKREIALIFDATIIKSSWYGREVFKHLIPLLDIRTNNSILCGDYAIESKNQELLCEAFRDAVFLVRPITYQHSTQFYIVYINNLSDNAFQKLARGLVEFDAYVGYTDATYHSVFKTLLSTQLSNLCIKNGKKIIQGHENDRDDADNVNMCGYPFEENGYKCVSLRCDLAGVLLAYKIERQVIDGFYVDTEFSLNAVNQNVSKIDTFDVYVEDAKLKYLKKYKPGSMHHAGLDHISANELSKIIREKIKSNYIYNMSYISDHSVTKFNLMMEIAGKDGKLFRLMAALEYKPDDEILRLITLY